MLSGTQTYRMVWCALNCAKGGEYELRMLRAKEKTQKEGKEEKITDIINLWRAGKTSCPLT